MKIVVFLGSVRRNRKGESVAKWIVNECKKRKYETILIDPLKHEDLLILKDQFKTHPNPSDDFKKLQKIVKEADAYIAITPEYNHGYSGAIKNALDSFLEEYYFKCFAIITYSNGGLGGVRAAEQLRLVCAELGAIAIPRSLQISKVKEVIDEDGILKDETYEKRIQKLLDDLEWYASALKNKREERK